MLVNLRRALAITVVLVILCLAYTFVETGVGQLFFQHQANGSLTAYGSTELGQAWTSPKWFQGRDETPKSLSSGPTNFGPRSKMLLQQVQQRVAQLKKEGITPTNDLVTGSGSGLDPDITPADAYAQVREVAAANHLPVAEVHNLVAEHVAGAYLEFFGSPYLNVLQLNEALAKLTSNMPRCRRGAGLEPLRVVEEVRIATADQHPLPSLPCLQSPLISAFRQSAAAPWPL